MMSQFPFDYAGLDGKTAMTEPQLSPTEQTELAACESIINKGLQTYFEVGSALMSIRDNRLYRAQYATFADYCEQRWGMSKTQANRLVASSEVVENLTPIGVILPANEAQARPLTALPPDQQREAWQNAVANAPNGKPTAMQVQAEANKLKSAGSRPAQNPLLETHPIYGGEANPAFCPTCGKYHPRWKAIDGAFWRCLICGEEVRDDAMTIQMQADREAEARMTRRRNGSSRHVPPLVQQRFGVLLLDPPWRFEVYSRDTGLGRSAESHYGTMHLEDLMALPMQNLMADDCAVFMWTTWPTLPEALQLGTAWGLTYKTCAFNWVKLNKNQTDTPFTGMGYWTRANSEPCLLFARGKPRRKSKSVPQILLDWEAGIFQTETLATPIGAHSEKPTAVYERIEALVSGPYAEVFARQARPGWTAFGNEIDGRSIQAVLAELQRAVVS